MTIPQSVREAAHFEEGDLVEIEITAEGILLRPKKLIDASQAWFWSQKWPSLKIRQALVRLRPPG